MPSMVSNIPYLSDCLDDLNSTSRLMRKWMEESPQIVYGPGLSVEVDFLRQAFTDWKYYRGIRPSQSAGVRPLLHGFQMSNRWQAQALLWRSSMTLSLTSILL